MSIVTRPKRYASSAFPVRSQRLGRISEPTSWPITKPAKGSEPGAKPSDTHRASDWLGYQAEIPFVSGVRRYVNWFRQRYPDPAILLEDKIENWKMPA